jgi:hypothetical protein
MATFTVHLPNARPGQPTPPEKITFVRDGFSWGAFLFGPFWLVWRRAWLAALLWTIALVAIAFAAAKFGLSPATQSVVALALAVVLGFEGPSLVGWTLARKGCPETDIVIGETIDEAEEVFFRRWPASQTTGRHEDRPAEAPTV